MQALSHLASLWWGSWCSHQCITTRGRTQCVWLIDLWTQSRGSPSWQSGVSHKWAPQLNTSLPTSSLCNPRATLHAGQSAKLYVCISPGRTRPPPLLFLANTRGSVAGRLWLCIMWIYAVPNDMYSSLSWSLLSWWTLQWIMSLLL